QPFIENALEHGLSEFDDGGKITIDFNLKDELLYLVIEDNGVGMEHFTKQKLVHSPLSIEITTERIALLNRKRKRKSSFTIRNANENQPLRKGVIVSFKLPINLALEQ